MHRLDLPCIFALLILTISVIADVDYRLIGSNMVLQRNSVNTKLWGKFETKLDKPEVFVSVHKDKYRAKISGDEWSVLLNPYPEGGPYEIEVTTPSAKTKYNNVMFGDVFLCSGQSNMEFTVMQGIDGEKEKQESIKYPNLRLFHVQYNNQDEIVDNVQGTWSVSSPDAIGQPFGGFSAVCYYYGKELYTHFNGTVPIGLILSTWGGTRIEAWVSTNAISSCRSSKPVKTGSKSHNQNNRLYNGMIAPLFNYNIRGAFWYQGENNAGDASFIGANSYDCYLKELIKSWRVGWGNEQLPFVTVQLANYNGLFVNNWPVIRSAQEAAISQVQHAALVTAVDIGDPEDVHPPNKKPLSHRLFLKALNLIYNKQNVVSDGPTLNEIRADGSGNVEKIELSFNSVNGLKPRGTPKCKSCCNGSNFNAFQVLTDQRRIAWDFPARIEGNKVVIEVPIGDEEFVLYVRYAWYNSPECMLYDGDGEFPLLPFNIEL